MRTINYVILLFLSPGSCWIVSLQLWVEGIFEGSRNISDTLLATAYRRPRSMVGSSRTGMRITFFPGTT